MPPLDVFEEFNWHDNAIHGFCIVEGEHSSQLKFDIDHITEWLPPSNNAYTFMVASADLIFQEVTDLVISVNYKECNAALQPMVIHEITREPTSYSNGYSTYIWQIKLNWPKNSSISFCASGFSQTSRMQPVKSGSQYLSVGERTNAA